MRVHNIKKFDMENTLGHGASTTVWVNYCPHRCEGCFNEYTWEKDESLEIPNNEIANRVLEGLNGPMKLNSLCWLGGEPLNYFNASDVLEVTQKVKEIRPDIFVYSYSGYTWEQIVRMRHLKELIKELDVIIDGRFMKDLVTLGEPAGSSNQRIIDVQKSLAQDKVVLYNWKENY